MEIVISIRFRAKTAIFDFELNIITITVGDCLPDTSYNDMNL